VPRKQAGHMTCTRPRAERQFLLATRASSTHDPKPELWRCKSRPLTTPQSARPKARQDHVRPPGSERVLRPPGNRWSCFRRAAVTPRRYSLCGADCDT
jgi:hypothetical protein